ncbi:MAG: hypothetical protein ABSB10_03530 [Candidatus Bathyarchaeia archaeon]
MINFKSNIPVELVNNSNRPTKISKKLGKYWVYVTNLRLIFYSDSGKNHIYELLENVDYYSFFETKNKFTTKYRIRVWIGLTRLDLIEERKLLEKILGEFRTSIQLKLKKGAEIIVSTEARGIRTDFPMFRDIMNMAEYMAKKRNVSLLDVLEKGTFTFEIENGKAFEMKQEKYYKSARAIWENEENWNLIDLPDGSIRVTLIPAVPITRKKSIINKS